MFWALLLALVQLAAPQRLDRGRFTVVYYPQDGRLAESLAHLATESDSFPGLPRPRQHVLIAIAPDRERFREWSGPSAPEWGAAIAIPEESRIVMQGQRASGDAGDPRDVLRHELAHLALHEYLGETVPRWFDEGYASYAAHEWQRSDILDANLALALRGVPTLTQLDKDLGAGASRALDAYALAYRAVADLDEIAPGRSLTLLFRDWKTSGSIDLAMRGAFGMTLGGFQQEWQRRTLRRYGGLALVGNLTVGGLLLAFLLAPLYAARRRRDRRRFAALVAADEAADRASESGVDTSAADALDQFLGPPPPDAPHDPDESNPSP